ncbi:MAG: hypothetical protein N2376_06810 [Clostridia bacterium]|nr:hypothetical protein [Clostridia bacterium]
MENATKAIVIAASVIITIAIVTIGFLIFRAGGDAAKSSVEKFNQLTNQLNDSEYTVYDSKSISGSEVVNAVKKFTKDNVGISVKTSGGSSAIWYNNTATIVSDTVETLTKNNRDVNEMYDELKADTYVNPNGEFEGKVYRDKNGRIAAISFTQK